MASQETSLYTESGESGPILVLPIYSMPIFLARLITPPPGPTMNTRPQLEFQPHPITEDPVIEGNIPLPTDPQVPRMVDYIGWAVDVKTDTNLAQVIARRFPASDRSEAAKKPFIILSESGKGRVAYFAGALDQAYFVTPYQYERALMVNALRWAAKDARPPVEVKAPMCVLVTFFQQEEGKRLIVHLLNEINTTW